MSKFSRLLPDDFALAVPQLPPPGRAWPRDAGTVQSGLWTAFADVAYLPHWQATWLLEGEANPAYAADLLLEWETDYGLPDPCTPLNPTLEQRRAAVLAKMRAQGGQSIEYYVSVAAALGYAITITEFRPFRCSVSACGDLLLGALWEFAWRINAPQITVRYFRLGQGAAQEPFWTVDNNELECRMRQIMPAHTFLMFQYG